MVCRVPCLDPRRRHLRRNAAQHEQPACRSRWRNVHHQYHRCLDRGVRRPLRLSARPRPGHARAAARTALAMQSAIEAIVAEDPSLPRFRVGIATGAALVGNIGSEELRNYVAHGDAVNLAARLQTGAIPGQVVVSAPTYALIRDLASVRPLGRFAVKGKSEEVEAFVLEHLADS